MSRPLTCALIALLALTASACDIGHAGSSFHINLGRQADEVFEWNGRLAAGQQLEIKGVNGAISAVPATGHSATVTADRRGLRSDPNDVRIEVIEHDAGVTICAVYPREGNACEPGDHGRVSARRNDVTVEFTVEVPTGVDFVARTVSGGVKADDLSGNVIARTVNGSITLVTNGHADATTVNGSIRAEIGAADWTGEAAFETVNGSVTLYVPESIDADLSVRTANGSINSDLDMTEVNSRRRRLEGRLGSGGRELRIKTVNGSVRLRPAE